MVMIVILTEVNAVCTGVDRSKEVGRNCIVGDKIVSEVFL